MHWTRAYRIAFNLVVRALAAIAALVLAIVTVIVSDIMLNGAYNHKGAVITIGLIVLAIVAIWVLLKYALEHLDE